MADTHNATPDPTINPTRHPYTLVAQAIAFIRAHAVDQPSLDMIAAHIGLSTFQCQRVFSEWAGVSPKRFLQYVTKERAREALRHTHDVLSTSLLVGLSGPGRLHDLIVTCEAMSPGEVKLHGAGITIEHGVAPTPFGPALLGWTTRGVCHVEFIDDACTRPSEQLHAHWPKATLRENHIAAGDLAQKIFPTIPAPGQLHLVLKGSNFQIKVWEALIRIPPGHVMSYGQLATLAGAPRAARAVGTAMAANTVGYLIPCHRVIRSDGDTGSYRWGSTRKAALLAWEAARATA